MSCLFNAEFSDGSSSKGGFPCKRAIARADGALGKLPSLVTPAGRSIPAEEAA